MSKYIFPAILLYLITSMSSAQVTKINYTLRMPKPVTHLFEVGISFENLNDADLELILPVWRPGRYVIFDFASGVIDFSAKDENDKPLRWEKTDKCTWRILTDTCKKVFISYKVYSNEFSLRTRGLNDQHGFIDETSVFMYSEKYRDLPLTLKVEPYPGWHVTTGLDNLNFSDFEFSAANYDHFADCPLEIGTQKDIEFEIEGKKHVISIFGDVKYDSAALIKDITAIIKKEWEFWRSIPYDKYIFIMHFTGQGGGGTEHLNSCVIDMPASSFEERSSYKSLLMVISHEFFHTWNVKRLRPKGLTPYNYTKENYTDELWIAEGGTSYYEGLILLRSRLYDVKDFLNDISTEIHADRRRPGNRIQSLAESSFDAWIKFWKSTQQSYNTETGYYGKGSEVSLILDLEIRHNTENAGSLDSVYRKMFEKFPAGKGYTNSDFEKVCEEVNGRSMEKFFKDYVYGTKPIEWETYLSYAGLMFVNKDSTVKPTAGLELYESMGKLVVNNVLTGSASEDAGVEIGDEIIALNGDRVNLEQLNKKIEKSALGDTINLTLFRNDKLKEIKLVLLEAKLPNYTIEKKEDPSSLEKTIYEDWLGVKW